MLGADKNWQALIVAAVLVTGCQSAFAHALTATGRPMELKHESSRTNLVAPAPWHTIQVSRAPGLPRIHFYDKLNPIWWLENADEPVPPVWYRAGDRHRERKWRFRNPFHNFDHYVIGVADKSFRRSGRYPERNSDPQGGWDLEIARWKLAVLPFVSYERHWITFYFGWREHGAFGIELRFHGR